MYLRIPSDSEQFLLTFKKQMWEKYDRFISFKTNINVYVYHVNDIEKIK